MIQIAAKHITVADHSYYCPLAVNMQLTLIEVANPNGNVAAVYLGQANILSPMELVSAFQRPGLIL